MFSKIRSRMQGEGGFTLIELLVVIIIIAILAAIAIPTFLGQRQKAQDAAAKSLVRNAMTAIETAYVDTRTFNHTALGMLAADLKAIEPTITFVQGGSVYSDGSVITSNLNQDTGAKVNTVNYYGDLSYYGVSTVSISGNMFGVFVMKTTGGGTYFVKKIGTTAPTTGW